MTKKQISFISFKMNQAMQRNLHTGFRS